MLIFPFFFFLCLYPVFIHTRFSYIQSKYVLDLPDLSPISDLYAPRGSSYSNDFKCTQIDLAFDYIPKWEEEEGNNCRPCLACVRSMHKEANLRHISLYNSKSHHVADDNDDPLSCLMPELNLASSSTNKLIVYHSGVLMTASEPTLGFSSFQPNSNNAQQQAPSCTRW